MTDDDAPEWTAKDFAEARPAHEVLPGILGDKVAAQALARGGPGRKARKVQFTLRVDADTLECWKAPGPGWQTRMSERLAKP